MTEILAIRKTHKYVGSYRHMDEWQEIGTMDHIGQRLLSVDDDDPCEYTTTEKTLRIRCDEIQPAERVERAIRDSINSHGCAHEYDCCGCWSTHVTSVTPMFTGSDTTKPQLYRVVTASSRNY